MNGTVVFALLAATVIVAVSATHHEPAHYHFSYGVHDPHTKDHKSQHEERNGHVVKGAYSLDEPDGTKRIVEYVAGPHTGFQAVVKRLGHAHHPAHYGHHGGFGGAESHVGATHWGHF
ncbi:adult-specific cuticular protein ACP-20-like [Agrilus planipennis]|uniref:Adult-specific cuticular protein ACP-20-like n=1 Tax=Agrilus planipennis TaxID=224129 RepID=A0A1W4WUI3_AGRPL|nr:adult-specific cuticular protein ACP-20-like [Agrilus planipennis]